ncbi:MFS transporter [Leucobacter luti]|uniref:EmrB/QacA subfamily drug resistance transporter n=1 Tax=Leucobacter luti TaxID=340320 RepID=A0A4Q7U0Y4_9MICO|nr:MFS transporter [Leucobacter luti]RZT67071.1 EmrB/QacA subfamily drug resistance transporter [Leucobacter luti]
MSQGEAGAAPPSRGRLALLFTALSLVTLLTSMSQHLFVPALPEIAAELGDLSQMSWVIVAFILASIPTMPIFGKLSDVFGRRSMMLVGIGIFTAGSLVGALAPTLGWLIFGRVLQGIGSGALVVLPQATIADVVPARQRGRYAGILSTVFAAATVAGPFVGGLLAQGPGWRWGFWVNIPVGIIAAAGTVFLLKLPRPTRSGSASLDYGGMALVSVATVSLALVTTWGGVTYAWTSPTILCLIGVGVLAIAVFPSVERRAANPVLPLALFREPEFVLTSISSIALAMVMFTFLGYLPTFVQVALGSSPAVGGTVMIPMAIGTLLGSTLAGQIVARTGRYQSVLVVAALVVASGAGLMAATVHDSSVWLAGAAGGIVGLGLGASFGNIILIVQNAFPHSMVGVATAATSLFRQIGGMFGTSLVGAMFVRGWSERLSDRLPHAALARVGTAPTPHEVGQLPDALSGLVVASYTDAMQPVYILMVVMALGAALVTAFLRPRPLADTLAA